MKILNRKGVAALFCLVLLSGVFFISNNKHDNFTCISRLYVEQGGYDYTIINHFIDNDGEGKSIIRGRRIDKNGRVENIHRKIEFDYSKRGKEYTFVSNDISLLPGDQIGSSDEINQSLKKQFQSFYLGKGAVLRLRIYPQGKNGSVFVNSNTLNFYCDKV
ncbi:hypothetical protein O3W44_23365 [Pantoea sp. LMR881]|uniref:hypothetical protein n=1 Tax=Pantoea sp. LMR881 TaxID=3014336 RepID=UPI0022AFB7C2|nr:hypothetical protein [Pantoea sp. LMR881]MCZ4061449.1 hypothetical protein [Pantoea sp. LMR881]